MNSTSNAKNVRFALLSNASDAGGYQIYGTLISIVAVASLGFTATQIGVLNALESISFLLFAIPLGMLVDRYGPAAILACSLFVKVLVSATTALFLQFEVLSATPLFMLIAVLGIATVASENAQTSIVPRLSQDKSGIERLISQMGAADRVAGIIAPGLAGIVAAFSGGLIGFAISAALLTVALFSAAPLLGLSHAHNVDSKESFVDVDGSEMKRVHEKPTFSRGFSVMLQDRFLLGTTILVAAGNMGLAMGDSLEPVLVIRELSLGKVFYGSLGTVAALSGIAATLVAPRVTARFATKDIFAFGAIVQSAVAALPLVALLIPSGSAAVMVCFSCVWSITLAITNIAGAAYTARTVDVAVLGQTSAARRMLTMGSVPLAAVAAGALADSLGIIVPLTLWPLLTVVAAVVFVALTPRIDGEPRPGAKQP